MAKQFDNTNTGTLWRNEQKADEKGRDYSGSLDVEGVEYWLSGFVRISRTGGKKFLVKPKQERIPDPARDADGDEVPW